MMTRSIKSMDVPRRATFFYNIRGDGVPDHKGAYDSHHADPYEKRTLCGLEVGNYPEGWTWGTPDGTITCTNCERIKIDD